MNAMPRITKKLQIAAVCSVLTASLNSLDAVAAPSVLSDEYPSQVVKFGDLNLRSSQGAAVLYARIKLAARAVCAPPYYSELEQRSISIKCQHETISRAVSDVHAPALTTYYLERIRATAAPR
jgi:UrcA family protein